MKANSPPEVRFILSLLRHEVVEPSQIALDWVKVGRLVALWRVQGLVFEALQSQKPPLPDLWEQFKTQLRPQVFRTANHNAQLFNHFYHLYTLLAAQETPVIPFKGPIVAQRFYAHRGLRPCDDLDVMVRVGDFTRVTHLLEEAGYQRRVPTGPSKDKRLTYVYQTPTPQPPVSTLELHRYLAPAYFGAAANPALFWEDTQTHTMGPLAVLQPTNPALLIYLASHGTRHRWMRLIWLYDIVQVARQLTADDWQNLLPLARRFSTYKITLLTLALAEQLLGLTLPEQIQAAWQAQRTWHPLMYHLQASLYAYGQGKAEHQAALRLFRFQILDTPQQKLRFWWSWLTHFGRKRPPKD